jgi:hypothetical protein
MISARSPPVSDLLVSENADPTRFGTSSKQRDSKRTHKPSNGHISIQKISETRCFADDSRLPLTEKVAEIELLWSGLKEQWAGPGNQHSEMDNNNGISYRTQISSSVATKTWTQADGIDVCKCVADLIARLNGKLQMQKQFLKDLSSKPVSGISFNKSTQHLARDSAVYKKPTYDESISQNPLQTKDCVTVQCKTGNSRQAPFYEISNVYSSKHSQHLSQCSKGQSSQYTPHTDSESAIGRRIRQDNDRLDLLTLELNCALAKAREAFS